MVFDVIGIVETGAPRARWLPRDPRTTLRLPQAVDVVVRARLWNADGSPVDLSGTPALVLTVRKKPARDAGELLFQVTGVVDATQGDGVATFAIPAAVTSALALGNGVWDLVLTRGGKRDAVVPVAPFVLVGAVGVP